jgi:hypothetical protein
VCRWSLDGRTAVVGAAFWQSSGPCPGWHRTERFVAVDGREPSWRRTLGVEESYGPVIWRMASWKLIPRTWTKKSMALPARSRWGQRQ